MPSGKESARDKKIPSGYQEAICAVSNSLNDSLSRLQVLWNARVDHVLVIVEEANHSEVILNPWDSFG